MSHPTAGTDRPAVRRAGSGRSGRLTLSTLDAIADLAHGFSLRNSTPGAILRAAMPAGTPLRRLRQVHGSAVREAAGRGAVEPAGLLLPEGDALVTDRPAVAIGVTVADCVPILLCDPASRGIAAVHAGWRGTVAGILTAAIVNMTQRFGIRAADLRVGLGPAIGPCCFEVGDEVIDSLLRHDPGATTCVRGNGRRRRVDLAEANRRQALAAGVSPGRIHSVELCTACHPELFWSYRREPGTAGRMLAFIGWRR